MPYTLLNHTGHVYLDGVSYFGIGAAPPLCGLQLDFYASPCSKTMFLVGGRGKIPTASRYDFILGLEWMNDKNGGGFCNATLMQGGLPGSDGADGWIFGVFGGLPLNSLVYLAGGPALKVEFNAKVTVIDDLKLHSSVQSLPLTHTGPWNVVSGDISDTARFSNTTPSFIASLPLDLPHTVGHLKYSATFDADGGDGIDGIAICVSWQCPSGLSERCEVLQKGMALNGSHVLSGSSSVGVWFATAYALKLPSECPHHFPHRPVDREWVNVADAEEQRSKLFLRLTELEDDVSSDEAIAVKLWVENLTTCPEGVHLDPLDEFEDQNCSIEAPPMIVSQADNVIIAFSRVSVDNFLAAAKEEHYDRYDCEGGSSGVKLRKIKSTSVSWTVPIAQHVLGSSGKIKLSLEPPSSASTSEIGDCKIVSADILSSPVNLTIQSGGINGDEDAVIHFHSDATDDVLNADSGMVTYTWQPNNFPRSFGSNELSLTLNITLNHGQRHISDDFKDSPLLSVVATPYLEFEWCSDNVCPKERGKCDVDTWPIIGWGQSNAMVPNCKCFLAYGGESCKDRTIYNFTIFVWLVLLCGSMAAGLPSIRLVRRLEPAPRIVGVLLMGIILASPLYHICDLDVFCVTSFKILRILDNVFTTAVFCSIMFYLAYVPTAGLEHTLMTSILFVVCILATAFMGGGNIGGTMAFVFVTCSLFMIGSWSVQIYNLSTSKENLGYRGAVREFFLSDNYLNIVNLTAGLLALFCGVLSFFLASKLNYAIFHSMWHICSLGSSYPLLRSRCWKCHRSFRNIIDDGNEGFIELKQVSSDAEEDGAGFPSSFEDSHGEHF